MARRRGRSVYTAGMRLRAAIPLALVPAVVVSGVLVARMVSDEGEERVTRAQVPGVGTVEGAVRPGTPVRPPARIPRAGPLGTAGGRELQAASTRAWREATPGDDSGPAAERDAVRRSLKTKVFLLEAAYACLRPPPAALAVLDFVLVAPQRGPALENLVTTRRARRGRQRCPPRRVRIDGWEGVRVRGDTATAVLRGALETRERGEWTPRRHEWRAILRRARGDWKIAALDAQDLDYRD